MDSRDRDDARRKRDELHAKYRDYTGFRMYAQPLRPEQLTAEELAERQVIKSMEITWSEIFSMIIAAFSVVLPYVLIIGLAFGF